MRPFVLAALSLVFVACSDPRDAKLPAPKELQAIKPQLQKLSEEERGLVFSYLARQTLAASLKGAGDQPASNVTIGQAIDDQRTWMAQIKAKEEAEKALRLKLQAERASAERAMREAVSVTLVTKKLEVETGYSGIVMDEKLMVRFGYRNNTSKDILGVKGRIIVLDVFGDTISVFQVSNDVGIKAGGTSTWTGSRSVKYGHGNNNDRKLAGLDDDKYKVVWEPQTIVFADRTTLKISDTE